MTVDSTYRVTADELRQFVERVEHLDMEARDIADAKKEVFAEAKGRGYDVKVLRKIIALRKRDPSELSEEEAILMLYMEALGMGGGGFDYDKAMTPVDPNELDDDAADLI